jgi:hypothetical protein
MAETSLALNTRWPVDLHAIAGRRGDVGLLCGPGSTTLPLVIFSRARLGLDPTVNAFATISIAVVTLVVVGPSYMIAARERRLSRGAAHRD